MVLTIQESENPGKTNKKNPQMTKFADPTEAIMVVKTKDNCKGLQIDFLSLSEGDKITLT